MGQQGILSKERSFGLFLHTVLTGQFSLKKLCTQRIPCEESVARYCVSLETSWHLEYSVSVLIFFRLCPSNFASEDLHISGTACTGITGCPDFKIWQGYFAWIVWRGSNLWTGPGVFSPMSVFYFFILAWQVSLTSEQMILKTAQWHVDPMSVQSSIHASFSKLLSTY